MDVDLFLSLWNQQEKHIESGKSVYEIFKLTQQRHNGKF